MRRQPEQDFHDDEKYQSGLDGAPRVILRNNQLSPQARLVYSYINSFAMSAKQGCFVSNARFAYYVGCCRRTVQRYIRELEAAGLIESHPLKNGNRQIVITGHLVIGNEQTHDTDVIPPMTPVSRPHDMGVTLGMDKGIELRNNKAPTGAVCEVDPKQEEIFKRFYDAYDRDRRSGNTKTDIRRALNKVLAEGVDPEKIFATIERKKKRLEAYRRDGKHNEFEPGFPYPVKFLRQRPWEALGTMLSEKPKRTPDSFSAIDHRFPNIAPSILGDLRKLKATEAELKELNAHWEYWKALKLNGDSMTDEQWLQRVREAVGVLNQKQL